MPSFIGKNADEILRQALTKLQSTTGLTSIGPGSVLRSIAEVITTEIGDLYSAMDYNLAQSFISTAQGSSLDSMGQLYDVPRKTLSQIATIDQSLGIFYFYLDSPVGQTVTIPANTTVRTDDASFLGPQFSYLTTADAVIPAGRTRAYASIRPLYSDSTLTVGKGTLTLHNYVAPNSIVVKATNPKPIPSQMGYEDDDTYRARLIKAIRASAGGTEEALRFAALAIPGVRDVNIRSAKYGLGSFEVVVTPESLETGLSVLVSTATALEKLRPVGSRMFVRQPDPLYVDISASIVVRDVTGLDKPATARRVEIGVIRYLNRLLAGTPLVYNQLISAMLDSSDIVTDVMVTDFTVAGVQVLKRNFYPHEDQQIVPGTIAISYA